MKRLQRVTSVSKNAKTVLINAPKNTPLGTLKVNGMIVMAVKAGMACTGFLQSTFSICPIMSDPTKNNTGAVADGGTESNSGAANRQHVNQNATTHDVKPVLPPSVLKKGC